VCVWGVRWDDVWVLVLGLDADGGVIFASDVCERGGGMWVMGFV